MTPTINELVSLVTEINSANGWREDTGAALSGETPEAQIACLSDVTRSVANVIEAIRQPEQSDVSKAMDHMLKITDYVHHMGAEDHAQFYAKYIAREEGLPVHGSAVQAIALLRLIDTETAEATEAILKEDTANLAEELADIGIRLLDLVGAWNETHPDKPIDLEAAILAKLEVNRHRGYKHGGKRA